MSFKNFIINFAQNQSFVQKGVDQKCNTSEKALYIAITNVIPILSLIL